MKEFIFKILRFSGLPFLFREVIQKNKVSILMFHEIDKETATKTFKFLRKKYNLIDLNFYLDAIKSRGSIRLPKKSLIITFDDGHLSNLEFAPVLEEYKIPVTIFLCSSIVNTNRHFWFKLSNDSISKKELKKKSNEERLKVLSKINFFQDKQYGAPQALQKEHIEQLNEIVNFQSHTKFHPILPMCNDQESREEIFESKEYLENEFNLNINAIAYPNGDYSDREVEFCKTAGYTCALTTQFGFNSLHSDLFRLKRISMNDAVNMDEVIVRSSGVWQFLRRKSA